MLSDNADERALAAFLLHAAVTALRPNYAFERDLERQAYTTLCFRAWRFLYVCGPNCAYVSDDEDASEEASHE